MTIPYCLAPYIHLLGGQWWIRNNFYCSAEDFDWSHGDGQERYLQIHQYHSCRRRQVRKDMQSCLLFYLKFYRMNMPEERERVYDVLTKINNTDSITFEKFQEIVKTAGAADVTSM